MSHRHFTRPLKIYWVVFLLCNTLPNWKGVSLNFQPFFWSWIIQSHDKYKTVLGKKVLRNGCWGKKCWKKVLREKMLGKNVGKNMKNKGIFWNKSSHVHCFINFLICNGNTVCLLVDVALGFRLFHVGVIPGHPSKKQCECANQSGEDEKFRGLKNCICKSIYIHIWPWICWRGKSKLSNDHPLDHCVKQ